jgi:hypothetical protein
MKQHYFIKFDPRINQLTGCYRATLILSTLEYWFQKKPEGFYKFIEACPHRLYKSGDSWTEQLDCDRKSFASSFDRIAVRYKSRRAYDKAEDKFQEKMYASIYDRNTNQTYFVRNHDLANRVLGDLFPKKINVSEKECDTTPKSSISVPFEPLRNGKNSRSYKEPENTTNNLSKDKSHAEEIVKKMIELWTALVEEGRGQIELTGKRIAFLKKAFSDKFDCCLEKWKKYCQDIASSRFLMGEVKDFRATLDWGLKFDNIQKILEGNYGIGDRASKVTLQSRTNLHEEISTSDETQDIKNFRSLCLQTVGTAKYISYFKNLNVEFREGGEIALISPHQFAADALVRNCNSYFRGILEESGENSKIISIFTHVGVKVFEWKRGGGVEHSIPLVSKIEQPKPEELPMEEEDSEDETLAAISLETKALREQLNVIIPPHKFPSWLNSIEVESVGGNGVLAITLTDSYAVNYCQLRFAQEILQAARILWDDVKSVVFHEKESGYELPSIEQTPKNSEASRPQSKFEQLILALKEPFIPKLMETI